MRKRITLSLSDNLLEKVRIAKEERDIPTTMSAMFENIIAAWDRERKLRVIKRKDKLKVFLKFLNQEVKKHPEWYIGDGPEDQGHDEDEGIGFWRNYYAKQKPPLPGDF